jgi:hypothetical protein
MGEGGVCCCAIGACVPHETLFEWIAFFMITIIVGEREEGKNKK